MFEKFLSWLGKGKKTGMKTLSKKNYISHKRVLHCPHRREIEFAFEELPTTGHLEFSCPFLDLEKNLRALENTGFLGIFIEPLENFKRGLKIRAFKGKELPCYETGRVASYRGSALAVLDDDHHFIFGEMKVCEKTATIYTLPGYRDLITVTKADSPLLERISAGNPLNFDCDTFERDVTLLAEKVGEKEGKFEDPQAILYPGPFKYLVLKDGTLVRRGVLLKIPPSLAEELKKKDKGLFLPEALAEGAGEPENFSEEYNKKGPAFLLDLSEVSISLPKKDIFDLTILTEMPWKTIKHLIKVLDSEMEYFILTGSDSRRPDGCCPSEGVEAANRLVEGGVLQMIHSPTTLPGACPTCIYVFTGEIEKEGFQPVFQVNSEVRRKVRDFIRGRWGK